MEKVYVEKTASRGVAAAPVYMYLEPDLSPDTYSVAEDRVEEEKKKFEEARDAVVEELAVLAAENEIFASWSEADVEQYLLLTERFLMGFREKTNEMQRKDTEAI